MRSSLAALVFLAATLAPLPAAANGPAEPLTKQRLLETLDLLKDDANDALVSQVQQRGVDFALTESDEKELKSAGASKKLLSAIRKSYRPVARPIESQNIPATLPGTGPATLPGAGPAAAPATAGSGRGASTGSSGRAVLMFYGTCPKGSLVIYNATISANGRKLAKLACDSYFYSIAAPGSYSVCVNGKKCQTSEVQAGQSYYFHVPAKMIGYGLSAVSAMTGDLAVRSLAPLDSKRFIAAEVVSVDSASPPAVVLMP